MSKKHIADENLATHPGENRPSPGVGEVDRSYDLVPRTWAGATAYYQRENDRRRRLFGR